MDESVDLLEPIEAYHGGYWLGEDIQYSQQGAYPQILANTKFLFERPKCSLIRSPMAATPAPIIVRG